MIEFKYHNLFIELRSLKFHSNINLSIETEFYFTKGLFRVAFHDTFHKIEIPGQNIQMKLIILLPRLFLSKTKNNYFYLSQMFIRSCSSLC